MNKRQLFQSVNLPGDNIPLQHPLLMHYAANCQASAWYSWAGMVLQAALDYQRAQNYLAEWETLFAPTDESELEFECLANCRG